MSISSNDMKKLILRILNCYNVNNVAERVRSIFPAEKELSPHIPCHCDWSITARDKRVDFINNILNKPIPCLSGGSILDDPAILKGNIENYIGMTQVPTGLVGPLRITGLEANGDFYVPLATTEGALIASYNRGARVASLSGGVRSVCLKECVQRTPTFKFENLIDVGIFVIWVLENIDLFKKISSEQTSHGNLEDIKTNILGNQITLIFEYTTGDASGQNMVTICTDAICKYIDTNSPVKPIEWCLEGNLSGDKKASAISFTNVRGKKVVAEAIIKKELINNLLHTTPEKMINSWNIAMVNGIQSGSIGVNAHFSNGLSGIFLACGQDVATVSEASVGITILDLTKNDDLYISVTLPNLIVGTVGGGTVLPTQKECLEILECHGTSKARKFAEICAAAVLCGEISLIAAIASGDFARAHNLYRRKKKNEYCFH